MTDFDDIADRADDLRSRNKVEPVEVSGNGNIAWVDMKTNEEIFQEAWLAANARGEQGARVKAGLAALESAGRLATRVPVQGEPNDDKEALRDEFRSYLGDEIYVSSRDHSAWAHGTMGLDDFSLAAEDDEIVESLVQIASRATVPDAATDDMSVPEFCEALGFVDGSTTPTRLRDIVEPIQWWDIEARDHVECARICEQCGETLARTLCGECHGGGQRDGGNGTVRECGNCGGAGWLHEGCAEVSYADLVAERDAATAAIANVKIADLVYENASLKAERDAALAAVSDARAVCLHLGGIDGDVSQPAPSYYVSVGRNVVATEVLAALDGAPEPEGDHLEVSTVETLRSAWTDAGSNPKYHHQMKSVLKTSWPCLHSAIEEVLK